MIEQKEYPYIPGEKGIDFSKVRTGQFVAESGRELKVEEGYGFLRISSCNHEMYAGVSDYGDLELRFFTKDRITGQYHPDMFASRFLEVALCHFENQGVEINEVRDIWTYGTDTYKKYKKVFEETGSKIDAAKSNLCEPLKDRGFTQISEQDVRLVQYDNASFNSIYVTFRKEPKADVVLASQ